MQHLLGVTWLVRLQALSQPVIGYTKNSSQPKQ